MDSFDVINADSYFGSFSSKDYSFLPEVLVHSVQTGSAMHNVNFKLENVKTALPTASSDIDELNSIDKVFAQCMEQQKLLGETLKEKNLLLKNQMKFLPALKINKQNLENAKKNIVRLEGENADLHNRISNLEIKCLDLENQKTCKNCESLEDVLQTLRNDKESANKTSSLSGEISKFNNFLKNHREILEPIYYQLDHLYHTGKHTDRQKEELNNVLKCLKKEINILTGDFCSIAHTGHGIGKKEQNISEELMLQAVSELENLKKELELKNEKLHTSEEFMLQASTEIENLRKELEKETKKAEDAEVLLLQNVSEMELLRKNMEAKDKKAEDTEALLHQNVSEMELLRKNLKAKDKKAEDAEALLHQNVSEMELLRKNLEAKEKKAEDAEALLHQNVSEMELLKNLDAKEKKWCSVLSKSNHSTRSSNTSACSGSDTMQFVKSKSLDEQDVDLSGLVENFVDSDEKEESMELNLSFGQEKQLSKIVEGYAKSIQDIGKELKFQLEELKNKLDNESARTKKYEKISQYLLQQRDEYLVKLKNSKTSNIQFIQHLHEEAVNLQESVKLEQQANQKDKEKLSLLMMQCEELNVEYIQAIHLLEVQSKDERYRTEEFTEYDAKSRVMIDHLTARVMDLELRLEDNDEDMKKLVKELVSVKEEADLVPILQAEISSLELAVSNKDSEHSEEIENLEKQLQKHRNEDSDASGYYSSRKRYDPYQDFE